MDYLPGYDKTRPITRYELDKYDGCISDQGHIDSNPEYCIRCERPFKKYPERDAREAELDEEYGARLRAEALGYDDERTLDPNVDELDEEAYYDGKLEYGTGKL